MGTWKVIIPELRDNYVLNPIAMGSGNYSVWGAGVTVNLYTNVSYLGYRYYNIQGLQSGSYGFGVSTSVLANAAHYVTFRSNGAITVGIKVSLDGSNYRTPVLLGIEGDWYVYGYAFPSGEASGSTTTAFAYTGGSTGITLFLGHIQTELGTYPTTPITGDLKGFTKDGYKWFGTPHASFSRRHWYERSGGYEVDLEDTYGLRVQYQVGTGMPPIQHNIQALALLPGALYAGHKVLPRILDLVTITLANTIPTVAHIRSHFINAIKPDLVSPEQPFVFRDYGINTSRPVDFYCVYDSGFEQQTVGSLVDQPVARFICYDPFAYETHTEGKELARQAAIANANYIVRKIDGVWANISSTFPNTVYCLLKGKDGCIYIGGVFTNAGDANGDYIVKWDPITQTLSSLGTGLVNGICYCLLEAPNGDIYAGGAFTSAGGVANTAYVAKWQYSTQTWVSLSTTSLGDIVSTLAWGLDGTLYLGGLFINAGGIANADRICRYTGTSYAAVGDILGANGSVTSILIAPNGDLYMTGGFSTVNSITVNYIAKYVGTPTVGTWSALGSGLNSDGHSLASAPNGMVYVGGSFTLANGIACNRIAVWNGITFGPLGSGANGQVETIRFDKYGNLWAGGSFTSMGGLTLADRMAKWSGTAWFHAPINLPGSPVVKDFCFSAVDDIYIGYDTAGTAYASAVTNVIVSNSGSHATYPKIGIIRANDGTSLTIKYIRNETTRQNLYLNYELQKGESLTIDLKQGDKSVVSSYYGPILRAILRGSDFSKFCLLGDTNVISVYISEAGSPTVMCWIEYKLTHWAADTVAV